MSSRNENNPTQTSHSSPTNERKDNAVKEGLHRGTIIQLGSGHPGEDESRDFEYELLRPLLHDATRILFFPFHPMPPHTGDMARFEHIHCQKKEAGQDLLECIQLRPPTIPEGLKEIGERMRNASVIVLGSGFPEPYIQLFRRTGLDRALAEAHQKGAHIIGYSAGTLAIAEGYYRPFTGRDLLLQLDLLDHISLSDAQRMEIEKSLRRALKRPDAETYVDGLRARIAGGPPLTEEDENFLKNMLWMEAADGFRLNPGLTVNPHFGGRLHYALEHLKLLAPLKPGITHIGTPNGCAVVTHWEEERGQSVFRGRHPHHKAYAVLENEPPITLNDGDPIPISNKGSEEKEEAL